MQSRVRWMRGNGGVNAAAACAISGSPGEHRQEESVPLFLARGPRVSRSILEDELRRRGMYSRSAWATIPRDTSPALLETPTYKSGAERACP